MRPFNVPETRPEKEMVPEVPEKKQTEPGPSKPVVKRKWTPDEELALAVSWASKSEDPVFGRNRNLQIFWPHMREKFFKTMLSIEPDYDYHRSDNIISSKWHLSHKVKKFNGIFLKKRQNRRSGQNDE